MCWSTGGVISFYTLYLQFEDSIRGWLTLCIFNHLLAGNIITAQLELTRDTGAALGNRGYYGGCYRQHFIHLKFMLCYSQDLWNVRLLNPPSIYVKSTVVYFY